MVVHYTLLFTIVLIVMEIALLSPNLSVLCSTFYVKPKQGTKVKTVIKIHGSDLGFLRDNYVRSRLASVKVAWKRCRLSCYIASSPI